MAIILKEAAEYSNQLLRTVVVPSHSPSLVHRWVPMEEDVKGHSEEERKGLNVSARCSPYGIITNNPIVYSRIGCLKIRSILDTGVKKNGPLCMMEVVVNPIYYSIRQAEVNGRLHSEDAPKKSCFVLRKRTKVNSFQQPRKEKRVLSYLYVLYSSSWYVPYLLCGFPLGS